MSIPTPQEFYNRAVAHADDERRLPLPPQSGWDIFPFERDGLVSRPLEELTLPEPPRGGEGGVGCWRCENPDDRVVWANDRWTMVPFGEARVPFAVMLQPRAHLDLGDLDDAMAAELGVLAVRVTRAVEALDLIGRVHLYKFGDGGAHLHAFLFARPAGMLQLRGSCLTIWDEMLPEVPAEERAATTAVAVQALAGLGEPRG